MIAACRRTIAAATLALTTAMLPADSVTYTATTSEFPNPERGLYSVGAGNGSIAMTSYGAIAAAGYTLAYGRLDLEPYVTTDIPAGYLAGLTTGFANARSAGVKVIVRIVYNDGLAESGPPAEPTPAQLVAHLEQLQPVFEANKDVIAFFQAGVIGAWGEWHSTAQFSANPPDYEQYNTPGANGRRFVVGALLEHLPEERFVQIRRPWFKDPAYGAEALYPGQQVDATSAFTAAPIARVGHHNDCFLASDTDFGTYISANLAQQKQFLASDTRYVPLGGETCNPDLDFANCANALAEMQSLRWTYLNALYHPDVLAEFTASGCMPEIRRRLGYRFELVSATMPETITNGALHTVSITLRNVGFAPMYNSRPVFLLLQDAAGNTLQEIPIASADPRRWLPGEHTIETSFTAALSQPLEETVNLALWLPDDAPAIRAQPAFSVRFANEGVWNAARGTNRLATSIPVSSPAGAGDFWQIE